jgi:hypothetical protein
LPVDNEIPSDRSHERIDDKLKEFERPLCQMPMQIERVKIGHSSGNHETVTKSTPASSRGHFIEGSKEETEDLAEPCRCCALNNLANLTEKGLNVYAVASQIIEYSSENCPILLNSSQHFQCSMYLNVIFHTNSKRLERDGYQRNVTRMKKWLCQEQAK